MLVLVLLIVVLVLVLILIVILIVILILEQLLGLRELGGDSRDFRRQNIELVEAQVEQARER